METTVSVVMATFNGERFLKEQLDSILNQSIKFDELIIRDDGSTDSTWKILKEYASKDNRIKIAQNKENIGLIKNFERAIRDCSGDLIALCDQDDIWLDNHLKVLVSNIGNKSICLADAEIIDEQGRRSYKKLSYCENRDYTPDNDLEKAYTTFFYRGWFQGASMLIKKSFFDLALPIPEIDIYHDFWFGCLGCFKGGIEYCPEVITFYRRHSEAVTGKKIRHSKLRTFLGHIVSNKALNKRPVLISAIRDRIGNNFNDDQKDFLEKVDLYFERRKSILGRIKNCLFELKHFNLIYARKV
ncbi:MAG: glycosyltransferase family 2 protein [Ruminococcus sp.]|nr:glycosyltransferase family 2 protein [Ruminococcus sp.]